jgi:diguanylate cyclase (GGDEF)-like protein/PAS domain S-box-containing protein
MAGIPYGDDVNTRAAEEMDMGVQMDWKKLDMAYQRLGYSFLSTLLISLLVVAVLFPTVPAPSLLSWLFAMCAIQAVRYFYYRRYRKLGAAARAQQERWHAGYVIGSAAAGLGWGSSVLCFPASPLDQSSFLLIFVLAGVAAFASVSMATLPRAVMAFMLTSLLPMALWLFSFTGRTYLVMGGIVIAYLILMLLLARQIHSVFLASLLSSEQNRELSAAVEERDRRAQLFFDSAPGCYFTLRRNADGVLSMPFASVGLRGLCGIAPESVADNLAAFLENIHPDDTERMLHALHQSALLHTPCREEFRFTDLSRVQKVLEITAQPQTGAARERMVEWHGFMQDITERRLLEEELRMKGHALDNSSEALYLINEQGRFLYVNEQAIRSLGYSREELLGMGVPDIDSNFADSVLLEEFERTKREGGRFVFESSHRRRDGSVFPVEIQNAYLEYNGQLLGMALARDISESKRVEQVLHFIANPPDDTDFLSGLAQHVGQTLGMAYVLINRLTDEPGIAETVGLYSQGSMAPNMRYLLAGTPCENVLSKQSCCYPQGLQSLFPKDVLLVEMGVDSYAGIPLCDSTGKPIGLIALMDAAPLRDMTLVMKILQIIAPRAAAELERNESDRQLRKREQEFRSLAESAPDNIIRYDREGRTLYLNERLMRQLGIAALDEIVGKRPGEIWPDGRFSRLEEVAAQVAARGEQAELELAEPDGKGGWSYHWVSLVPERDEHGQIIGTVAFGRDVTGRKQMEFLLAARETEFRSLAENSPDAIFRYDRDCRRIYVNQTVEKLTGRSRDELLGKSPAEFIPNPAVNAAEVQRCLRTVLDGGVPVELEMGFTAADGRDVTIHNVFVPEFAADGSVQSVLCMGRDISERKQAELELQHRFDEIHQLNDRLESHARLLEEQTVEMEASQEQIKQTEAWYRGILHSAPDGMMVIDERGRITQINAQMERMFGYAAGELVGLAMEVLLPAEKRAAHVGMRNGFIGDAIRKRDSQLASNLRACRKDGSEFLVDVTLSRLPENDYNAGAICAAVRDVTGRRQMEAALAQREREFRTLVENVNDVVVRYDRECRRTYVNPAWVRVNGISAEEAVGRSPQQLSGRIRPMSQEFEAMLRKVMQSRQMHSMDLLWNDEAGEQVCFQLEAVPEFDSQGEVIGVLTVARDITERKRMEATLAQREQEFRTLVENAADTVARYGPDMRRLYANPAFAQLVEGGVDALIGKKPSEVPGGAYAELYEEKLAYVLAQGVETEFELKWCDNTGRELCSLISLTPEFGKDGRVASVLAVGRDISELYAFRQKIHQMAFYDNLTALPNRALFNDRLRQMLTDASWHGQQAAVMLLDLDRFKAINDTLGHPAGDLLLCDAAARLSHCVRAYDTVARLGGDEFAILLPEIRSGDDPGRVANKILDAFRVPFMLEGKEVFVSTSIGIAVYPDDSADANDLIKQADSAMYFAKRSGRNNFRFYARNLTESAVERLSLESELRRAIERGELELHYQPKIGLNDFVMRGSEALLRWNNPVRGMVPPDQFISIAEDSGLIVEIGEWVLREACRTACDLNGAGRPLHKVAINLSVRQFQSGDLVATVCDILEETACLPEWIELEITESLLLEECDGVLDMLKAFRAIGITIAIDDFGTGYSALSYLARFPINTLKIDRSFIRTITTESYRAELVKAIISIAHSLGQQVVAEGVETAEQALFLQAHGCHVAQGYLFSKPLAKAAFIALPTIFNIA